MNHMIPSEIAAEVPLHLALLSCGALGYMATRWADSKFVRPRVGPFTPKAVSCDDEVQKVEVGEASHASVAQRRNAKKQSRTRSVPVSCEIRVSEMPSEDAATAPAITDDVAESAAPVAAAPPSARIQRMLAKKAERKARKAQERVQQCQEVSPACQEEALQEVETEQVPESIAATEVIAVEDVAVVTTDEAPQQNESLDSEPLDEAPSPTKTDGDVALAELSTADEECPAAWVEQEPTSDECPVAWAEQEPDSDEEMWWTDLVQSEQACFEVEHAARREVENAAPECEEYEWQAWDNNATAWECERQDQMNNNECDDWMTPFEELMRPRDVATQWYSVGLAPMPGCDVEPVLAADGRQLYTDGQQFFVLACVDTPAGQNAAALQMVAPITDPCDPKHQAFSEAMYASQEAANDRDWDCSWNLGQA